MRPWVCFSWDAKQLGGITWSVPPLSIRVAAKDEGDVVLKTILTAFGLDSTWSDVHRRLEDFMEESVREAFRQSDPPCIVAVHGSRIIGASLLDPAAASANHLVSGPMILHEYRNRGVGSALLAASLAFIRDRDVPVVRGVTRADSTTARFVYPKFSGVSAAGEFYPLERAEA
jgi:GNAT superfamily N-acetyltransferase